jgi:putative ABC transport system permease protein
MMGEFIRRNLLHRPLRTSIGVLAVGVEVALVILIVGLTSGMLREVGTRIQGIGADIMVQPPNASRFINMTNSPMPVKIKDRLGDLKYVQAVTPVLLTFNATGSVDTIWGIDSEGFREVSGGLFFLQGHDLEGPDDLLVDDWAAKGKKLKVGDTYKLLNHEWRIAGIVEHGKGARLFVPLATLQELVGARDKATIFLVKCTRPEHTDDAIEGIRGLLGNYTITPLRDYLSLMTSTNIPGLQTFINAMIVLAVSVGLLVIFLTMYTTVIERTRDIGVLKSLGAGKGFIIRALLSETAMLCVLGSFAGLLLSYGVRAMFLNWFPTLSILITMGWFLRACAIAMAGAMLGASYPTWLASRKDAVEALSYD